MWKSIQNNMTWRAVPIAGAIAGSVFLFVNIVLTPIMLEVEPTLLLRYMASLLLGSEILTEPSSLTHLVIGILVHYTLSMLFTLVIAVVVHRWGAMAGIIGGGILGLAIYLINLYTFTLFFDWFFAINSSVLFLSHILFGAVAGGVYELFDHYDTVFEWELKHEAA